MVTSLNICWRCEFQFLKVYSVLKVGPICYTVVWNKQTKIVSWGISSLLIHSCEFFCQFTSGVAFEMYLDKWKSKHSELLSQPLLCNIIGNPVLSLQHPPTQMTEMVHLTGWLIYVFEIPVWPNIQYICNGLGLGWSHVIMSAYEYLRVFNQLSGNGGLKEEASLTF